MVKHVGVLGIARQTQRRPAVAVWCGKVHTVLLHKLLKRFIQALLCGPVQQSRVMGCHLSIQVQLQIGQGEQVKGNVLMSVLNGLDEGRLRPLLAACNCVTKEETRRLFICWQGIGRDAPITTQVADDVEVPVGCGSGGECVEIQSALLVCFQ
jgi:hypothetical protein